MPGGGATGGVGLLPADLFTNCIARSQSGALFLQQAGCSFPLLLELLLFLDWQFLVEMYFSRASCRSSSVSLPSPASESGCVVVPLVSLRGNGRRYQPFFLAVVLSDSHHRRVGPVRSSVVPSARSIWVAPGVTISDGLGVAAQPVVARKMRELILGGGGSSHAAKPLSVNAPIGSS